MVGITSYGAYIPYNRLSREEIYKAWGGFPIPGEKAIASHDEDTVTMAWEAANDCLQGFDPKKVGGLYLATTSYPYKEKQCSTIVSTALDMGDEIRTADYANSLRGGTIAIASALDAVKAGTAKSIVVTAADNRMPAPGGFVEGSYGDGAAALLIGDKDVIATIEDHYFVSDEFCGEWRADGDTFIRSWEDRMVLDEGYSAILPKAMSGLMKKHKLEAKDFAKVVASPPIDIRRHGKVVVGLGFGMEQIQEPFFMTVGNTGTAMAMMMLVAALEDAEPGDKILFANYGNGADAFLIEVTDAIKKKKVRDRRGTKGFLSSKRVLNNYATYLRWRGLVTVQRARRPEIPFTSISALKRSRKEVLRLYGDKCKVCGNVQYQMPFGVGGMTPIRVCYYCQAKDQFEDYRFSDKKGHIFTYSLDLLADVIDPPGSPVFVDFEGGGRGWFELTDRDPDQVKVGMPVEMVFRKMYFDRGIHNYYWKARPVRG